MISQMLSNNFVKYGSGSQNIVFLLGANNDPDFMEDFFKFLSSEFTIYAIKYPGIGNGDIHAVHTTKRYLQYFTRVIDEEIQLDRYVLAGFSFGGYLALLLASTTEKPKIEKLLLFSPLIQARSRSLPILAVKFIQSELQNRKAGASMGGSIFDPGNFKYLKDKFKHTRLIMSHYWKESMQPVVPTLCIIGGADIILDSSITKEVLSRNANVKLIEYKELGHDAFVLDPNRTLSLMLDFLR